MSDHHDYKNSYSPKGLYHPSFEHDSCGVGFVARIDGKPTHSIVEDSIRVLVNLEHRGAVGSDKTTGDGAGILVQMPDLFFRRESPGYGIKLPSKKEYAVGMIFLPQDRKAADMCVSVFEKIAEQENCPILGWRDVPVSSKELGELARNSQPVVRQVFIERNIPDPEAFERKLYVVRRLVENEIDSYKNQECNAFYIVSLSARTINYKGFMNGKELPFFYPDLNDKDFQCSFAVLHQRYSTNTFPSWSLAQPFRFLAHNGEINTLSGNKNRMITREARIVSDLFGDDIEKLKPIITPGGSDSSSFDNVFELLVMAGRSLPHAMMMMIPEAWGPKHLMGDDKRAFYEYHAAVMEPWDGPAAMVFTDGRYVGATLDRNGLRPARYTILRDGIVVLASETGVLDFPEDHIKSHGRLQPGKMFLLDLEQNRIIPDNVIKATVCRQKPYRHWVKNNRIELRGLLAPTEIPSMDKGELIRKQVAFGYTEEDLNMILAPMATHGQEPVGSMGDDSSLAVLSNRPQLMFNYFKQLFAQVTNPPIDPLREELVMSLMRFSGKDRNLLDETPEHVKQLKLHHPILNLEDMKRLRSSKNPEIKIGEIDTLFPAKNYGGALRHSLESCFVKAESYIKNGSTLLILTDRNMDENNAPIPILLVASGLHHYLIRKGLRSKVSLIIETGEAREIMHFALLIGFGASAVCPYLAFSTIRQISEEGIYEKMPSPEIAADAYIIAIKKGLMKTMSRIGISTIRSYFGAQIFEAVGLSKELVDNYFSGTVSRIGGIGLDEIAHETLLRYNKAFDKKSEELRLEPGGVYKVRKDGEKHLWSPDAIYRLQHAVRTNDYKVFKEYAEIINDQSSGHITLRSLLQFKKGNPVPIEDVEPVEEIVKRFVSSAMSMGSLSKETHETIAIAMNRLGGRSNSGEGGEDVARYLPLDNGDSKISAIKQVASGRFGVTINYLTHSNELQIKIAQGAKPGEGGQLPGHKVSREIARIRHSTPGVTLISPPPHHDIYSIEDLAQLIYDLKAANPDARVSVKLVSEAGVGTIAAGVVKGKADTVVISGHDGGTGASPLTSIKHAGLPWELGLAETQQTLVMNNLRSQVRVHVDGQLRTGRDLAIAALMGADEFGFGTITLVSLGCVLLRKCHLNNCSVGVATQDPKLRANFAGKPEHVENLMRFLAQDLREHMAELGYRTLDQMIGNVQMLEMKPGIEHYKAKKIDFDAILFSTGNGDRNKLFNSIKNKVVIEKSALNEQILSNAAPSLENKEPIDMSFTIRNVHRAVGTYLSGEIAKRYGEKGLPENTINIHLKGTAGQSFGAFLAPGVNLTLEGSSNDYLGKGMSGGRIVVFPPKKSTFLPSENVIAGNTVLYGATGGEVYLYGTAGERFAVRNSGAIVVTEGVGDHGCEYMTGGIAVILGDTGKNFAAGMSGGIAFIYNESEMFDTRCNLDMVDIESVTSVEDEMLLRSLIEKHYKYTQSQRAKSILDDWHSSVPLFAKVMPIDYRLSLQRMQYAEDPDTESTSATEEVFMPSYMEIKRENPPKRPVEERIKDFKEIEKLLSPKQVEQQASRCRDCGIPYCHSFGCPVNSRIPDFNHLVASHSWKNALEILHQCNNFPEITGRVCPALCESACTLAINMFPVTIKHIELQIVEKGWKNGWIEPMMAPVRTDKKIAVIGSGPAGLAAAQQLARMGHTVTVYEKDNKIGGILRYGIPDFKLEKWVIDRRLEQMSGEGVVFETGVNVGADISAGYLKRSFDAVVIAAGSRVPRDLTAPGRELSGTHFAMDFLTQQNKENAGEIIDIDEKISAFGKNVLVIGGGDTGSDCVGTSRRQGALSIQQIEIMPKPSDTRPIDNPWPNWPLTMRTSTSHEEGCERAWSVTVKELIGENGKVKSARLVKVEWTQKNGRMEFSEIPGSEYEVNADLVLLSMGFLHIEKGALVEELGLQTDKRGNLIVDNNLMTTEKGVFAAGDSVLGASLVVRAINQGRMAAESVNRYLLE